MEWMLSCRITSPMLMMTRVLNSLCENMYCMKDLPMYQIGTRSEKYVTQTCLRISKGRGTYMILLGVVRLSFRLSLAYPE